MEEWNHGGLYEGGEKSWDLDEVARRRVGRGGGGGRGGKRGWGGGVGVRTVVEWEEGGGGVKKG